MEPKFQTSFIPKKQTFSPIGSIAGGAIKKPSVRGASIFMAIAVVLFIVSIGAVAGAYIWKSYLVSMNDALKKDLASREEQFQLDLIVKLKQINTQIDSAKSVLTNHIAMSKIFETIQLLTIEKVRFLGMDLSMPLVSGGNATIAMKGYGTNLAAVAFQSDVLARLSDLGLSKIVKNPIVGDPSLESTGAVSFGFSAEINPNSLLYVQAVGADSSQTPSVVQ
jgi:hypothetical protein